LCFGGARVAYRMESTELTNTFWKKAISGDATNPANWTNGIGRGLDAIVDRVGGYQLTDDGAFAAHSLTIDPGTANFVESATGTMRLKYLTIGGADLAGRNHIGTINLNGSLIIRSSHALGNADVNVANGFIQATHSFHIRGELTLTGEVRIHAGTFGVTIDGPLSTTGTSNIDFQASNAGTFYVNSTSFAGPQSGNDVHVFNQAAVKAGAGAFGVGFAGLLSNSAHVTIDQGGSIELNGLSSVSIDHLQGQGRLANTGTGSTVFASDADFHGRLDGGESFEFDGINDLHAARIALNAGETLSFAEGSDTTLDLRSIFMYDTPLFLVDMSSNGTSVLTISNNFAAGIEGFGSGDQLDLRSIDIATISLGYSSDPDPANGGSLLLSDGSGHQATIHIVG
jgi:hypothetical protein